MALFIFGHASARFFGTLRKTKYGRTYKKQATLAGSSREHDPYDFLPPPATHYH